MLPPHILQRIMGGTFFAMGVGTMLLPSTIIDLCCNPEFFSNTIGERFIVCCFGSQAALQGLLLLTCEMKPSTWFWWGLGILPFVALDIMVAPSGPYPMSTWLGAAGDGIGNAIFLTCCYLAYGQASRKSN